MTRTHHGPKGQNASREREPTDDRQPTHRQQKDVGPGARLHRSLGNQAVQRLQDRGMLQTSGERQADDPESTGTMGAPDVVRRVISKPGTSLAESTQREMESKLGGDFSDVRLHTGPEAAAAESIKARAFTVGNDVAFNKEEHEPETDSGKNVIAHELTNVGQQTDARVSVLPKAEAKYPGAGIAGTKMRIQPKLEVSSSNDPAEKEAERVAEQVMQLDASTTEVSAESEMVDPSADLCPWCATGYAEGERLNCTESEEEVQANYSACDEKKQKLKRSAVADEGVVIQGSTEAEIDTVRRSSGESLPDETRTDFESRFGADFSDVSIHTGSKADEAARSINAEAFTVGSDVAFRSGAYDPDSSSGKKLIAHELTHVVQQSGESVTGSDDTPRAAKERHGELPRDEEPQTAHEISDPAMTVQRFCELGGGSGGQQVDEQDGTPLLRSGDRGQAVERLQELLDEAGIDIGDAGADGIYGGDTENAVRAFQEQYDLTVDGIAGDEVWSQLDESVGLEDEDEEESDSNDDVMTFTVAQAEGEEPLQLPGDFCAPLQPYKQGAVYSGGNSASYMRDELNQIATRMRDEENLPALAQAAELLLDLAPLEGWLSAINTWDSKVLTWGPGFAHNGGLDLVWENLDSSVKSFFGHSTQDYFSGSNISVGSNEEIRTDAVALSELVYVAEHDPYRHHVLRAMYVSFLDENLGVTEVPEEGEELPGGSLRNARVLAVRLQHWLPAFMDVSGDLTDVAKEYDDENDAAEGDEGEVSAAEVKAAAELMVRFGRRFLDNDRFGRDREGGGRIQKEEAFGYKAVQKFNRALDRFYGTFDLPSAANNTFPAFTRGSSPYFEYHDSEEEDAEEEPDEAETEADAEEEPDEAEAEADAEEKADEEEAVDVEVDAIAQGNYVLVHTDDGETPRYVDLGRP